MALFAWISGSRFSQLLAFSAEVEDDISHRRLHKLKLNIAQCSDAPTSRYFGTSSYYHVLVASGYALFFSAVANVVALRPAFSLLWIIAGIVWLALLMTSTLAITKGWRSGLLTLFYGWFLHLAISLATLVCGLIFQPLSLLFGLSWVAGVMLLWLAWRMINSREMANLVRWCLRLKMQQEHARQLQRRAVKKGR